MRVDAEPFVFGEVCGLLQWRSEVDHGDLFGAQAAASVCIGIVRDNPFGLRRLAPIPIGQLQHQFFIGHMAYQPERPGADDEIVEVAFSSKLSG